MKNADLESRLEAGMIRLKGFPKQITANDLVYEYAKYRALENSCGPAGALGVMTASRCLLPILFVAYMLYSWATGGLKPAEIEPRDAPSKPPPSHFANRPDHPTALKIGKLETSGGLSIRPDHH